MPGVLNHQEKFCCKWEAKERRSILALANHKCGNGKWSGYFKDFKIPYGFYGPEEYAGWLQQAGLTAHRVELIPKDMVHRSKDDLAAWVRTTWLPYTQRIPAVMQDNYIAEIVDEYLSICPLTRMDTPICRCTG